MPQTRASEMLLGALVADAACLGLHWIYEPERIAEVAATRGGLSAFTPVDAANYADTKAYFAHGARRNGMLTQYGEVLRLTIQSMNANGGDFDVGDFQQAFAAYFGPGGAYQGYIDRPTMGALDNIAADKSPSGINDDQNPAVARLPAILARYHGQANLAHMLTQAMQVTNVNDVAAAYGAAFADVLSRVMGGAPVGESLDRAAAAADPAIRADLSGALSTTDGNSTDYAGRIGRACHLPTAGPVSFHILQHATSYRDAVERNILAGGDSAGRSLFIGAVMGCAHGVATPSGIPLAWVLKLEGGPGIWEDCLRLGQR